MSSALATRHALTRAGLSTGILLPPTAFILHQSRRPASTRDPSSSHPSKSPPPTAPTTTTTTLLPPKPAKSAKAIGKKQSLVEKYAPRLGRVSTRTGVPLPSLGVSFLILHELSAIVPLVLLFFLLQALGSGKALLEWIGSVAEVDSGAGAGKEGGWRGMVGGWYDEGVVRVEKVGKRYGILGYDKADRSSTPASAAESSALGTAASPAVGVGDQAAQQVADAISAYVLVKALLPLRIAFSIGAAPAFARFALVPVQRLFTRFRQPS